MSEKLTYRGGAVTNHGGSLDGMTHNVRVQAGDMKFASLDGDVHHCPIHGPNLVHGTAFVKYSGIKHVKVGDSCDCGAIVVIGSDNTYSE